MTANEAIKKASKSFKESGIEDPDFGSLFFQAMLFMMEELIRIISSSHPEIRCDPLSSPPEEE